MMMGVTIAVQPTIIRVLKILLPTTLPTAISAVPLMADEMLTVSSGAEVPKATIVRPITMVGMWRRLATAAAPSVSMLAPMSISANPPMSIMLSIIV